MGFIFLAGIAIATGFNYLWLGITKRRNKSDLAFGLFATAAGIYYLSIGVGGIPAEAILFFATAMFVLFPWYFAFESSFIHKKVLWLITLLGLGYFVSFLLSFYLGSPDIKYFFSYSVYLLSAVYAVVSTRSIRKNKQQPGGPYIFVTAYYIIFVLEEIAYNFFGLQLPWRRLINFNYLDLFPMVLIGFKIFLMAYNELVKTKLERSVAIYERNLKIILNQAQRFVLTLNLEGRVIFANPFFMDVFKNGIDLEHSNFIDFLHPADRENFQIKVLESEHDTGQTVASLDGPKELVTVAWSYVKLQGGLGKRNIKHITLFGADISQQKKAEEQLNKAYSDLENLKDKLLAENLQLKNENIATEAQGVMIGKSSNFNYVLNRVEDVAPLDVPVLLEGETGVGKELFASAIHTKSGRKDKAFIKVNCSAIPENLMESELFGFEKGAFTGADKMKRGMFELADGGTLFLDEIGDLPISLQPKLLRALQEGEIKRLGSEKPMKVDIRLLAATNLNLQEQVEKGEFRSDLFYRLNVFPITIPPLRKRQTDIPLLIDAFISGFNKKYGKEVTEISGSLMDELTRYYWPGNIRQLRNVIERSVITSSGAILKLVDPLPMKGNESKTATDKVEISYGEIGALADFERRHIIKVLNYCNWKISGKNGAAEILSLPASTLRSKMKKLGISPPAKSP